MRVEIDADTLPRANVKAVELTDVGMFREGTGVVISTETADVVVVGHPVALVAWARSVLSAAVDILTDEA
jgi:hypothetical protein